LCLIHGDLYSNGCLSFPLVGNLSLKKDAGQAGMTKKYNQNLEYLLTSLKFNNISISKTPSSKDGSLNH